MKLSQDDLLSIIESVLFAGERPLSLADFSRVFDLENIPPSRIKKTLQVLAKKYQSSASGIELKEVAGGWQMRTKEENKNYIRRLIKGRGFYLSAPAMEVLSVIAYRQPCRKGDVDEVRGVESGHLLSTLMEKRLICFGPKSSLPGRAITYKTTPRFLEIFGLKSLSDLPSLEDMSDLLPLPEAPLQTATATLQATLQDFKNKGQFRKEQQAVAQELDFVSRKIKSVSAPPVKEAPHVFEESK